MSIPLDQAEFWSLVCLAARFSGWAWFDPLLGRLPGSLRLAAAAVLALVLWPGTLATQPQSVVVLVPEFALGAMLALAVRAVFAVVESALLWTAGTAGSFGLPDAPPGQQAVRDLAFWLAGLAFLGGGGLLLVVDALRDGLDAIPPGGLPADASLALWIAAGSAYVLAAFKLALPLLAFVLLVMLTGALALRRVDAFDPASLGLALGAVAALAAWIWAAPLIAASVMQQLAAWSTRLTGGSG